MYDCFESIPQIRAAYIVCIVNITGAGLRSAPFLYGSEAADEIVCLQPGIFFRKYH